MKKILLVLTGGTICSFSDNMIRSLDTDNAASLLADNYFRNGDRLGKVEFDVKMPVNVFSENFDINIWNILIGFFKGIDISRYDGIVVAHGTDTLGYTASLFSVLLNGIDIPVVFVSSNAPLDSIGTNGNENFAFAVDGICNGGIKPGVWVAYKNISDGVMYIHNGCGVMQSPDYTDDFYSINCRHNVGDMIINSIEKLDANVFYIRPYVGMDYSSYRLDGIDAVLHGAYHSGTLNSNAFEELKARCRQNNIPLYVSPCKYGIGEVYSTVCEAITEDVICLYGLPNEAVYTKLLVAYSMYDNKAAKEFMLG